MKDVEKVFGKGREATILVWVWVLLGVFGLMLYQQTIFDHYFGFLYPAPFLIFGWMVSRWAELFDLHWKYDFSTFKKGLSWLALVFLLAGLGYVNLSNSPLRQQPNRQLQKTEAVAEKIMQIANGKSFNLALIARHNYDEAYRYILEWRESPVVMIDPANAKDTIAGQLFVICENKPPFKSREDDCNPIAHPRSEIALFGWAKIDKEIDFDWGTKLYKLIHSVKVEN